MATTVQGAHEQRVVLRNISWETYERLLAENADRSAPRLTYDRGDLEIMSPLPRHERFRRAIESIGDALNAELDATIDTSFGSTTFRREEAEAGFEPDACFYIGSEPLVRGKDRIDLRVDPPPDVVVEIDITSPSIPREATYARLGVSELWRYDGDRLEILLLEGERYVSATTSRAIPGLTAVALTGLLRELEGADWKTWLRRVREWAHEFAGPPEE